MPCRKDALLGASRVVDLVNRIGLDNALLACATVGMMQVHPNSRNVIPGRVFFTVDFRHPDDAVLARMDAALQRYATDWVMTKGGPLFQRAPETGRRVAIVGAGPAGLACAYRLALAGHDAVIFDARTKPGGLNEYGSAAYKTVQDFAQREIEWLHSIGGIEIKTGMALGRDFTLDELRKLRRGVRRVRSGQCTPTRARRRDERGRFHRTVRQADDLANVPVGARRRQHRGRCRGAEPQARRHDGDDG